MNYGWCLREKGQVSSWHVACALTPRASSVTATLPGSLVVLCISAPANRHGPCSFILRQKEGRAAHWIPGQEAAAQLNADCSCQPMHWFGSGRSILVFCIMKFCGGLWTGTYSPLFPNQKLAYSKEEDEPGQFCLYPSIFYCNNRKYSGMLKLGSLKKERDLVWLMVLEAESLRSWRQHFLNLWWGPHAISTHGGRQKCNWAYAEG